MPREAPHSHLSRCSHPYRCARCPPTGVSRTPCPRADCCLIPTELPLKENVIFAGEDTNRPWILVGDKTSKGGIVFTGSPQCTVNGKGMARVGDRATCSCNHCRSRGYTIIASGSSTFTAYDVPVARDRDLTDCGAVLMSTEGAHFAEAMKIASALESGRWTTKPPKGNGKRFLLQDSDTGKSLPHRKFVAYLGGQKQEGVTDGDGYAHIEAHECQPIELHIVFQAPRRTMNHGY
jgi:uncharacterized Zn-binding protein involved in type VI secretion